ncbi:MAG TPA: hypothetical protein VJ773_06000 [Gemmatimonadales bacterium]|nr:hypothetical protein [Gemmatimonadales bacterium]
MRRAAVLTSLLLLACGRAERQAEAPPPPPPPPTLADFAGTWESVSRLEGVPDTVVSQFSGPAAETGWMLMLPGREPIPMRAWIQGDSLVAVSEKYPSILRKGVMVQVRTAGVLQGDGIVGNLLATYDSTGGQALVKGTFAATRIAGDSAAAP